MFLSTNSYGHGGDIWNYCRRKGCSFQDILDYSANINPMGPPESISGTLKNAIPEITAYPEPFARGLRQAVAQCYDILPEEVIIGNGAAELIFLFCRALGKINAILPAPTFSEYALACQVNGGVLDYYYLNEKDNFAISADNLLDYIKARGKSKHGRGKQNVLFLCQPNNPTGQVLPEGQLQHLFSALQEQGVIPFLDLSFLGFIPGKLSDRGALPAVPINNLRELLRKECFDPGQNNSRACSFFLLFSFTKLFALPGIRLGFGIGPRKLIAAMEKHRDPWSVNVMAQRAGEKCLQEREYVTKSIAYIEKEKINLREGLVTIKGMKVYPSTVNFMLCNLKESGVKAVSLAQRMAEKGILIRDASNFPGLDPYFIRLAVRLPQENEQLIKVMKEALIT
jgi:threonine-phosphate decarboxylase